MKTINLSKGYETIVDDDMYNYLNQWKWSAQKGRNTYYAVHSSKPQNGKQKSICMHREILGLKAGDGRHTDHINGDGLDNRRCNLRICTRSQNHQNRHSIRGTSQFKGCSWYKRDKNWEVSITLNSRKIHLGYFDNEIEAAKAYDKKAGELFGEFAKCNFIY